LSVRVSEDTPSYTNGDIAALVAVQKLIAQGYSDDQISDYLTPVPSNNNTGEHESVLASPTDGSSADSGATPAVEEILNTIISNQQAILNSQATMREMVNVVIQDNFSLKDENRKLRDRMLEIERVLAEYQRREETRKERIEHRLRALEGTVGALQQQLAQLVQIYRSQGKRGGWFS
jgi:regulator of replication initiation timing